jgi:hypothetical protein
MALSSAQKAALVRRLQAGKAAHHGKKKTIKKPMTKKKGSSKGFAPPWLQPGKEPSGATDPVPPDVQAKLAKKYG